MSTGIARDLSAKLQQDLSATLERNTAIARHVLDGASVAIMMLEAAVMMTRTTAATIANMSDDDSDVPGTFDATITAIVQQIHHSRDDALERTMAVRREQRR